MTPAKIGMIFNGVPVGGGQFGIDAYLGANEDGVISLHTFSKLRTKLRDSNMINTYADWSSDLDI